MGNMPGRPGSLCSGDCCCNGFQEREHHHLQYGHAASVAFESGSVFVSVRTHGARCRMAVRQWLTALWSVDILPYRMVCVFVVFMPHERGFARVIVRYTTKRSQLWAQPAVIARCAKSLSQYIKRLTRTGSSPVALSS